jgi:hypothetical protein
MMPVFSVRGNYFLFGSVFIKKNNQTEFKKKNKIEPKPIQTERFQFGSIFSVWLGFTLFFSSLARFFSGLGSVCFFGFRFIKLKPNWSVFLKF